MNRLDRIFNDSTFDFDSIFFPAEEDIKKHKQLLEEISISDNNLMVTPKEIDFVIEKMGLLIGNGINKTIHKNFNTTK